MTIQEFCITNALPLSKTTRLIRHIVHSKALEDHSEAEDVEEIGFDYRFEELGLRAYKGECHARIQYAVTNSERLRAFVLKRLKYDVLAERDIDRLIDASSFLLDIIADRSEWQLVAKENGVRFPPNREYFGELERVLRKAGRT